MKEFIISEVKTETAILVGLITKEQDEAKTKEYLDELEFLADTAGAVTVKRFTQRVNGPSAVTYVGKGKLEEIKEYIKQKEDDGRSRYDFQFENKRGYKTTVEGLSEKFNPEYWNYAKLISGVLRYRMPIDNVIKLVGSLQLKSESINTWKIGVERALKKYIIDGTEAKGQKCPMCGSETLVYQEGCLICKNCGASRCG